MVIVSNWLMVMAMTIRIDKHVSQAKLHPCKQQQIGSSNKMKGDR